jgi:hypothetical protein
MVKGKGRHTQEGGKMEPKEAYEERAEAQLEELKARIGLMEAKAAKAKAEAKVEYSEQIEELRQKQKEVEERLERVQAAGSGAWRELTAGVNDAMTALQNAVTNAAAQLD